MPTYSSSFFSHSLSDYYQFALELFTGRRAQAELEIFSQRLNDLQPHLDFTHPLKVLDLGNGRLSPQLSIFAAKGHIAVGADIANAIERNFTDYLYRAARTIFSLQVGIRLLGDRGPSLTVSDVGRLPFATNSFDLIVSNAAFEHFLELPKVLDEARRVLRPNGIIWCGIHPFACLSGGHNIGHCIDPIEQLPNGIEPWDHLRKKQIPLSVPLNKLKINDYKELFSDRFSLLDCRVDSMEGEHLLTSEIEEELKQYSREDLLSRAIIIVAKNKK